MMASRRRWHFRLWLALVPLTLAGLIAALALREPSPSAAAPAAGSPP
jgi:hypothetical protein